MRASGTVTDIDTTRRRPRLALTGEWDLAERETLRLHLRSWTEALDDDDVAVLDLRRMTFADSSVLQELVLAHARLTGRGIRLMTLCRRGSTVSRVIAITGLDDTLGVVEAV